VEALVEAILHYTEARDAWAKMAVEAKDVYVEDITFGFWPQQRGHWADRVPDMDADIADMKAALARTYARGKKASRKKSSVRAIETVKTRPQLPTIDGQHTPAKKLLPGEPMRIDLKLSGTARGVDLYYRHVNQAQDWQMIRMDLKENEYSATIPGEYTDTRFAMSYYFAIDMGDAGKVIFPGLDEHQANMPYYVVRH
jgi:hypothetical protein